MVSAEKQGQTRLRSYLASLASVPVFRSILAGDLGWRLLSRSLSDTVMAGPRLVRSSAGKHLEARASPGRQTLVFGRDMQGISDKNQDRGKQK